MGASLADVKYGAIDSILNTTKTDLPKPPSFEEVCESASVILSLGCVPLGIPIIAEFGRLNQPEVPVELTNQLVGKIYREGFVVEFNEKRCMVTDISINPPRGFMDQENPYDRLKEYQVSVGKIIPLDSRITSLSLISADEVDDLP